MSITSDLEQILSARYGKDVRQAIHDSIEEGYNIAVQAQGIAETSQKSAKAYAQAALASEQAAEDYKTAAEQAAQQAMSGTPEGYADLVAKVNSIYRQTATSFNVVGTSEGSALAHTIYGMSVQDGTPTPSVPVEIQSAKADFKCVGKNLIPYPYHSNQSLDAGYVSAGVTAKADSVNKNRISFVGTSTGRVNAYIIYPYYDNYLAPGNYKIKVKHISGTNRDVNVALEKGRKGSTTYVSTKARASLNSSTSESTATCIITSDEVKDYSFALALYGTNNQTYDDVYEVELTLADADQTYEVNQHKDITTNITLRAIEVASTDDYTYERDGKYYIADTIDWSEDRGYEITRRIGEVVLDGSTPIASISGNTVQIMNTAFSQMRANINAGYSNRFAHKSSNYTTGGDANTGLSSGEFSYRKGNVTTTANQRSIYIKNSDFTTISNASTWFASNNTNIAFVLETPTTESITSEQAQALLSLKTYDEATSISATGDVEPSLDLEYSKDRNTALALTGHNLAHKNALKLNDINTALIELGGN